MKLALLVQDVVIRQNLQPGTRVTVKMGESRPNPGEDFRVLLCSMCDLLLALSLILLTNKIMVNLK